MNDGAAVRVSLVCFARKEAVSSLLLDGTQVGAIYPDLTAGETKDGDLTKATQLSENANICFMGSSKKGSFDIPGELARKWLRLPNPNGKPNSDVIRPWSNGLDIARRPRDMWIIDFGTAISESEAAFYEAPFQYVKEHVKPERDKNNRDSYRRNWWKHAEPRPGMRKLLGEINRYISTPAVTKHRVFHWFSSSILPDQQLLVFTRSDDATFGVLHSRFHELWALRMCTWLGVGNDPRYTPTTCFETFPFPAGVLADPDPDSRFPAIAEAARRLNELRENWLNPPEWVDCVPEVVPGYPARIIARPEHAAELKQRTLTNLYNQRPAWLDNAHKALDRAVATAYGWEDYAEGLPDAEILGRLLALNLERAG